MDELQRLLASCAERAEARLAALVGRDGLVVESASGAGAEEVTLDLPLAAAEATDLITVADRLFGGALGSGSAGEIACRSENLAVGIRRLTDRSFVLLVLPPGGDAELARATLAQFAPEFETVLA